MHQYCLSRLTLEIVHLNHAQEWLAHDLRESLRHYEWVKVIIYHWNCYQVRLHGKKVTSLAVDLHIASTFPTI
jgi:hypothetical protein